MREVTCICSSTMIREPFSQNFDALICDKCGSRHFIASKHGADTQFAYDGSADKYKRQQYLYGKELRWAHQELLKMNWHGRRVLEIGCFNGFFLDELRNAGADVFGFDVNNSAIEIGEDLYKLHGRLTNSIKRFLNEEQFDDVICIDVVEHLDNPKNFVNEILPLLKPGGRFTLAGPILERRFHDKSDYPPHHKWWFSTSGLKSLLNMAGFTDQTMMIQHNGTLFLRNLIGKLLHGFNKREYRGETLGYTPQISSSTTKHLYKIIDTLGQRIFELLKIPYCSAIFIVKKPNTYDK